MKDLIKKCAMAPVAGFMAAAVLFRFDSKKGFIFEIAAFPWLFAVFTYAAVKEA